jgi:hypothetical protein
MLLLILGMFGTVIFQPLGNLIFVLNEKYTQMVLNFTYNMPTHFDFTWRTSEFSSDLLVYYLTFLFGFAIYIKSYQSEYYKESELAL